jgi:hypothetical protein
VPASGRRPGDLRWGPGARLSSACCRRLGMMSSVRAS